MRQTLGWVTLRASWISRLNRSTARSSAAISGRTVFSATRLVQLQVLGLVDLAHAAPRDEPQDDIAGANSIARPKRGPLLGPSR